MEETFEEYTEKRIKCVSNIVDEIIRKENKEKGNKLCDRCDGTGNELYSMYRRCKACNGTGIYNENFDYSQKD